MSDTTDIQRLASDKDVASTTKGIKHPYEDGMAEKWISSCQRRARLREIIHFAIILVRDDAFIGASTIHIDPDTPSAELSYWIGKPYWNEGYASELSLIHI